MVVEFSRPSVIEGRPVGAQHVDSGWRSCTNDDLVASVPIQVCDDDSVREALHYPRPTVGVATVVIEDVDTDCLRLYQGRLIPGKHDF